MPSSFIANIGYLYRQNKELGLGIPWWSRGKDLALSLLRVQVQALMGELRSHEPRDVAKKKKELGLIF